MPELIITLIDTTRGTSIHNVEIDVQKMIDGTWRHIDSLISDDTGKAAIIRQDSPEDPTGYYEAVADIGAYFLKSGYVLPTLKRIDKLPIRFGISELSQDTNVIVSVTPFGYNLIMA